MNKFRTMNKLFLLVCIALSVSCNSKKEEKKTIDKKVETIKKEKKEVKTLTEFLVLEDKINVKNLLEEKEINKLVGNIIDIKKILIFKEPTTRTYIIIQFAEQLSEQIKNNYEIIVRAYPSYPEDRTEYIKKNKPNVVFDTWYIKNLNEIEDIKSNFYITKRLSDNVDEFDTIKLQLYNKQTKKIVSGDLEINML